VAGAARAPFSNTALSVYISLTCDTRGALQIQDRSPVATIEKWATGRVMQRLVLARSVGHGETGFRLRSSVFAMPLERVCVSSQWCR